MSSAERPPPKEPGDTVRVVVDASLDGQRLDKALVGALRDQGAFATRADVQRWLKSGRISIEGRDAPLRNRTALEPGMVVLVRMGQQALSHATPDPSVKFDILFEDAHLLVLDKPSKLVVHPARGHADGTLVNGLLALPGFAADNADPRDPSGHLRPGIVHRLDKDTSGVMVVAKHPEAREGLKELFARHDIERHYLALVQGRARAERYDTTFGRHPKSRQRFTSKLPRASGGVKQAVTIASPMRLLPDATLVRCTLHTGRTHQIRVHMAEQSRTPVLADGLYGHPPRGDRLREAAAALGRQGLHAAVLGFKHPITQQQHRWESALPEDMAAAVAILEQPAQ